MLRAIDFDDETSRHAREVDDVSADRNLSPKMRAAGFKLPEMTPEFCVCARRVET
jgi:hypothetical protein